jgi:AcrR family transcriptional regulator
MSPRKYDMTKRRAAVEQTRRRIIEATMELHGEQGVRSTASTRALAAAVSGSRG